MTIVNVSFYRTRATLREQIVQNQYTTRILGYANIVFGGWDFTLSGEKSALMRQKALFYEIRVRNTPIWGFGTVLKMGSV